MSPNLYMPRQKKQGFEAIIKAKIDTRIVAVEQALQMSMADGIDTLIQVYCQGFGIDINLSKEKIVEILNNAAILVPTTESTGSAIIKAIRVVMHDEIVDAQLDQLLGDKNV